MSEKNTKIKRPPVVAVMGHIDHGKSTLLSYIRKNTQELKEAGGITQHISAYEIKDSGENNAAKITFIDTPGHEAFSGHRNRAGDVADIAILVVATDDGVKTQTKEALQSILDSNIPYIVALNKIDKPDSDIEKTKISLAEIGVYVEGFGGTIPWVGISAKTGVGIDELLDMIQLTAEMEGLEGDTEKFATGIIIESSRNAKSGIGATCIIKDGSMKKKNFIACSGSYAPIRNIETWDGEQVDHAHFSSPVHILGWSEIPRVGEKFTVTETKEEAELISKTDIVGNKKISTKDFTGALLPLVIKADTSGSVEAIIHQIEKIKVENVIVQVIHSGIGAISENDIRSAIGREKAFVIGFNVKPDSQGRSFAEREGITIHLFDVIYNISEWIEKEMKERKPVQETEIINGSAKILKTFSKTKDKQILGGRMESGVLKSNTIVRILRRGNEITKGEIKELQSKKVKVSEIDNGEFGTMIESKLEILPGDIIESVVITKS